MKAGYLPGVLFLVLLGIFCRGLFLHPQELPSTQVGKKLPYFHLKTLGGGEVDSLHLPSQFLLLNVWASWCGACAEEQTFLMKLAEQGILLYGLNYKDKPNQARRWLLTWGNPYQVVAIDRSGNTAIELGVYGTPETFLIDPDGYVVHRYTGVLTESIWEKEFQPLINKAVGGLGQHTEPAPQVVSKRLE